MTTESSGAQRDRRRYERLAWTDSVLVVSARAIGTLPVRDISAGGAFVYSPAPPPVGEAVRVELCVGPHQRFSLPAVVLRHEAGSPPRDAPGFAVRFEVPQEACAELGRALAGVA